MAFWLDGEFFDPVDIATARSSGPSRGGLPGHDPPSVSQLPPRRTPEVTIQEPEPSEPEPPPPRERRGSFRQPGSGEQPVRRGSMKSPDSSAAHRQRRASALPGLGGVAGLRAGQVGPRAGSGRRQSLQPPRQGRAHSLPLPHLLLPPLSDGLLTGAALLESQLKEEESSDTLDESAVQVPGPWLRRRFAVTQPIKEPAPTLVYHSDRINTQFYNRTGQ